MAAPEVPALADERTRQRLTQARSVAVDAQLEVESLEEQLRAAKRKARSRMRHYENLVAEYHGQMSVLDEEGVMDARPDLR